ncbi:MAG: phenylacetate--CoA ligase family protein [Calditrichaeota bacterium]|nr:phenylacetate--CoA ligase family protein [Calditrichota bacterium]
MEQHQLSQLRNLVSLLKASNPFYREKLGEVEISPEMSLAELLLQIPFTTKNELIADQAANPPWGTNLTFPQVAYSRFHQTSATTGQPMRWLDTPVSWGEMLNCWREVYRACGVSGGDTVFFAFSFGPFLGFWTAFEAANQLGALTIPGGSLSSKARVELILTSQATALCCTPTYAIRLGEVAREADLDLSASCLKAIIVAGEPGGSVPEIRSRIEELWPGATVYDHHGMTEMGPVSYPCPANPMTLHVLSRYYIAEILPPEGDGTTLPEGQGELILTNLFRHGSPLLRYRTGDLVDLTVGAACSCGTHNASLKGGILSRVDDMVTIRGVNIYPAALERVVREFPEIREFQVRVTRVRDMDELSVHIEIAEEGEGNTAKALQNRLQDHFNLRIPVKIAADLPRFEMKAKRWIKES